MMQFTAKQNTACSDASSCAPATCCAASACTADSAAVCKDTAILAVSFFIPLFLYPFAFAFWAFAACWYVWYWRGAL